MLQYVDSVFAGFRLYNSETDTVIYNGKPMSYNDFDEEYLAFAPISLDEYFFNQEVLDQLYIEYLYIEEYIEYYKSDVEKRLECMF